MQVINACSACGNKYRPGTLAIAAFVDFADTECVGWLCTSCIKLRLHGPLASSEPLTEEAVGSLFHLLAEKGCHATAVFQVGGSIGPRLTMAVLEQIKRIQPRWEKLWEVASRHVASFNSQKLRQCIVDFERRGHPPLYLDLEGWLECVLARERIALVKEEEGYWQALLELVDVEMNPHFVAAMAEHEGENSDDLYKAVTAAAQVAKLMQQVLEQVLVEHPAHVGLLRMTEIAAKYKSSLLDIMIQAELKEEYARRGTIDGDNYGGDDYDRASENADYDEEDARGSYDDHDFEDRDPYY